MGECISIYKRNDEYVEFKVSYVRAKTLKFCDCIMRITKFEIILFEPNREQIIWPLSSILEQTFNQKIFSFVCNNNCTTGKGKFKFKSRNAKKISKAISFYSKNLSENINNEADHCNLSPIQKQIEINIDIVYNLVNFNKSFYFNKKLVLNNDDNLFSTQINLKFYETEI